MAPRRYFLQLAFKGTRYHGWQRQPGVTSVQEVLESYLYKVFKSKLVIHPCGRTDKGVHATQFYIHFNYNEPIPESAIYRLNKQLPLDIRVINVFEVHPRAHAQFDAVSRTYQYHFHSKPDPLLCDLSIFQSFDELDFDLLDSGIAYTRKVKDFAPVCIRPNQYENTLCKIGDIRLNKSNNLNLTISISANRFLQGMMRMLVGRIMDIGLGNLTLENYMNTFERKGIFKYNTKLAPHGLRLVEIQYDWERILRN